MSLLDPFIAHLHGQGRLRIWSLVITVFGDVVQPRGGVIATQDLLRLTRLMRIEDGAVRTALSRLASDGWVERARNGRASTYALSPAGIETFLPATRRIYDPLFVSQAPEWRIVIGGEGPGLPVRGARLLAGDDSMPEAEDALEVTGLPSALPGWVAAEALPDGLAVAYDELAALLAQPSLDAFGRLTPDEACALRVLIIHPWRRLVLRHPRLPHGLVDDTWPGCVAHAHLQRLYPALLDASAPDWTGPDHVTPPRFV